MDGFADSQELLSVVIPNTVTEIEDAAFVQCMNLVSVNIPNSVTRIGSEAFEWCFSLSSVTMGTGVKEIEDFAFSVCRSLRSITIPECTQSIGVCAFLACNSLRTVTIPASVTKVSQGAFTHCANLKEIIVSPNNAAYSSADGVLFNKDKLRLIQYPAGKPDASYSIPESVVWISNSAFRECQHLKSLFIPSTVQILGEKTDFFSSHLGDYEIFSECVSLVSITYPKGLDLSKSGVPETTKCIAY